MKGAYFIGEPGVGKSTLVKELTKGFKTRTAVNDKPFRNLAYLNEDFKVVARQLGGLDPQYPGTDRLSMSVQPKAIQWLTTAPAPFVFGEGDRLATKGFLDALEANCEEWRLIVCVASAATMGKRREARGSNQDPKWLVGRKTKIRNLTDAFVERAWFVDMEDSVAEAAWQVAQYPIFDWLKSAG